MDTLAQELLAKAKWLEEDRRVWDDLHQQVQDYVLPNRGSFTGRGDKPNQKTSSSAKIINGVATTSLRVLGAGMQGGLTSPARPWFRLQTPDHEINKSRRVKSWLSEAERRIYAVLAKSNFYTVIHSCYIDEGSFGQVALACERDTKSVIRFVRFPPGQYSFAAGPDGSVDTIYRRFWMPAKVMVQRFGMDRVSENVRQCVEQSGHNPYTYYETLHIYEPRAIRDENKVTRDNWPWRDAYMEMGSDELLEDGGTKEQAIWGARWDIDGDDCYGRSPVHDCLNQVMSLQTQERTALKSSHLSADPPWQLPTAYEGRIRTVDPGMHLFSDVAEKIGPLVTGMPLNIQHIEARIARVTLQIREALYNDLFLMMQERNDMTATEVAERKEEKLLLLGPVIERQFHELLDPIIDRVFAIMLEDGLLPPSPSELAGMEIKVDYISLLAQAQKMVATQGLKSYTGYVASLAQFDPSALDYFDSGKAQGDFAEATGVNPEIVRPEEEVQKIRSARAKGQAQAQQAAALQAGVDSAHKLSQTSMEGDNALTQLGETLRGGAA